MKTARLTQQEFDKLLEYSLSVPTGKTIGKQWKMKTQSGQWYLREYYEPKPGWTGVITKKIRLLEPKPLLEWDPLPWEPKETNDRT